MTPLNPGANQYDDYYNATVGQSGQVYVFARIQDPESGNNPGPRGISLIPEGASQTQTIAPANDVVIKPYLPLPLGTDANKGFAKYKLEAKTSSDGTKTIYVANQ